MDATIYMPLLNEGTAVWRPVVALCFGEGRFRVAGEPSDDEKWAFPPGVTVIVDGDNRIIAEAAA
jgi:hypothetical protein